MKQVTRKQRRMICDFLHLAAALVILSLTILLVIAAWNLFVKQFTDLLEILVAMTPIYCIIFFGLALCGMVITHWAKVIKKRINNKKR